MAEQYQEFKNLIQRSKKTLVMPIGGCGEFGLNMTLLIDRQKIYVIDAGIMFPDATKLGVDAIIPDVDSLFSVIGRPTAYLITHGHEDHIGALAHLFKRWNAPLYCTRWTSELIIQRFERMGRDKPTMHIMKHGDKLTLDHISVDWVRVNHSIPMSCSLYLQTSSLKLFHTGDFKFDLTSPYEEPIDLKHLSKLVSGGVDWLLADSTNALSAGDCPSESVCIDAFREIFEREKGNIFVATFSSNLWRILTIVSVAAKLGIKVHFAGSGIEKTVEIARKLDMFQFAKGVLADKGEVKVIDDRRIYICTGCQAEPMAALTRMVRGEYHQVKMREGDTVVFSSRMIPGSERSVAHLVSECIRQGLKVITPKESPKIHVSGHAYQGDLRRMLEVLRPKWLSPIHGTFAQLNGHAEFALDQDAHVQVFDVQDGMVMSYDEGEVQSLLMVDVPWLYIDGMVKTPIDGGNLNKRLKIGELGLCVFSGLFAKDNWKGEVYLDLRGLSLPADIDPEDFHRNCCQAVAKSVRECANRKNLAEVNEAARVGLRQVLNRVFKKKVIAICSVHF